MSLADNIWWTRKARIETEKRLLANLVQSKILLILYSFCSVAASIYYLKINPHSELINIAWVIFSILVLSVSLFNNGHFYKQRASLIKECYLLLGGLNKKADESGADTEKINSEYENILSLCENHTDRDFYFALCNAQLTRTSASGETDELSKKPNKYIWFLFFLHKVKRFLILLFLYAFPFVLFSILEYVWRQ